MKELSLELCMFGKNPLGDLQQTSPEFTSLYHKLRRIKEIEGKLISKFLGLKLTGENGIIKKVELRYIPKSGQETKIEYTRNEFYKL